MDKIVYKIRNDIMDIEDYFKCEIKYKELLFEIERAGGYVFNSEIVDWANDRNLPSALKKDGLMESHKFQSAKEYMYLTNLALRFVKYSEDDKDYSKTPRNKLVVSSLQKIVQNKALYSSAILFAYFNARKKEIINPNKKEKLNMLDKSIFDKVITNFWNKTKPEIAQEAISKSIGLRRNAKVFIHFEYEDVEYEEYEYVKIGADKPVTRPVTKSRTELNGNVHIIDYGSNVAASHYIKLYLELLRMHGKNSVCHNTSFTIYSYSARRAKLIKANIENLIKDKLWLLKFCNNNKELDLNHTTIKMMFERYNTEVLINSAGHKLIDTISNDLIHPKLITSNKLNKMTLNKFTRLDRMKW